MQKSYAGAAPPVQSLINVAPDSPANGEELAVSAFDGYPATGYFVVSYGRQRTLADGTAAEEKMLVTLGADPTNPSFILHPTLGRGYDNTQAKAHPTGEIVEHVLDAATLTEFSAYIYGAHAGGGDSFWRYDADHPTYLRNNGIDDGEALTDVIITPSGSWIDSTCYIDVYSNGAAAGATASSIDIYSSNWDGDRGSVSIYGADYINVGTSEGDIELTAGPGTIDKIQHILLSASEDVRISGGTYNVLGNETQGQVAIDGYGVLINAWGAGNTWGRIHMYSDLADIDINSGADLNLTGTVNANMYAPVTLVRASVGDLTLEANTNGSQILLNSVGGASSEINLFSGGDINLTAGGAINFSPPLSVIGLGSKVTTYSSGTTNWTPDARSKVVLVRMWGGGGQGGGGSLGSSVDHRSGGGGGGGGAYVERIFRISDLTTPVSITVAAGGSGGGAGASISTSGNNGTTGGNSLFGGYAAAYGGGGGLGGVNTTGSRGSGGGGGSGSAGASGVNGNLGGYPTIGVVAGMPAVGEGGGSTTSGAQHTPAEAGGGAGGCTLTANALNGGTSMKGGGGGGGAGGVTTGSVGQAGANGGQSGIFDPSGGSGGAAGASASNGSPGSVSGHGYGGQGGGGAGASGSSATNGGTGGAGAARGGGGGGGGACRSGGAGIGGTGGNGGDGFVIIIEW